MILLPDKMPPDDRLDDVGPTRSNTASVDCSPSVDEIILPENAARAWERVRRNHGCAGVDGVTIGELEPVFESVWAAIARALLDSSYQPQPLRRVCIPKPSGGSRLLGVPTVIDRVVDQATAQVLAPHWEPRFSPQSFAYRPGRNPRGALEALEMAVNRGAQWVLHLDIEDFFDSVPHHVVVGALARELHDRRLAILLDRILTCGVFEDGLVRRAQMGLAQGSPLSPLLANIVLHRLDTQLEAAAWPFVRYADDCCVLLPCEEAGPEAMSAVAGWLADLGLRVNERKTAFGHFTRARFLGFALRPNSRGQAVRYASPESVAEAEKALVGFATTSGGGAQAVASETSQILRSWLAYYYTPDDEARLRALRDKVLAAWRQRFPWAPLPENLGWDWLMAGRRNASHVDYSGKLRDGFSFLDSVDWAQTMRCIALKLFHSRWWGLECDFGGFQRSPRLRLRLGGHRINLRL